MCAQLNPLCLCADSLLAVNLSEIDIAVAANNSVCVSASGIDSGQSRLLVTCIPAGFASFLSPNSNGAETALLETAFSSDSSLCDLILASIPPLKS